MHTTIQLNAVSKKYRLGLTRTSLPSLVSEWFKPSLIRKPGQNSHEREFWALRDVSFELKQGESLALIGANGAGKTTIMKILANITMPTSGSVRINGNLSALIELGAGFHPDLTGRENIFLNGTILGLSRRQISNSFDEIVDFAELDRFIDTPIKRYSSGMVVRLGFAVAASIKPAILLVDEVLAVGDAAFQQKCMTQIRSLIKNGTSIVFVSHNIYLIQAVCNRALYLEQGQIKQMGNIKEIIDMYEQDLHKKRIAKMETQNLGPGDTSGPLEITKVDVMGTKSGTGALLHDQQAQIQIHYNAYEQMGRVQVSAFIKRADGLTCCMMRTKLDHQDFFLERGQGIISLYLEPLQLITGSYFVEVWFLDESDSMTIIPTPGRSDWFSVKGSALSYSDDSGIFEPNSSWSHQVGGSPAIINDAADDSKLLLR